MVEVNHSLTFEIAGLGIKANLHPPDIIESLRKRYKEFPLKTIPTLQVDVHLSGQVRTSAMQDAGMIFREGELRFMSPGFEGYIREGAGKGQLSLSSQQPVEDLEYFFRVAYALLAFQAGGIILHAAGIVRASQAYLFFGHSGSGKTTVSRLSSNDLVLNDDLLILMPTQIGWQVFGTPFWNPTQVKPAPQQAALAGLFRLVQDSQVYLEEMSPSETLAELIANVPVIPADSGRASRLIERLKDILDAAPVKRLHFLPDLSFWDVIAPPQ